MKQETTKQDTCAVQEDGYAMVMIKKLCVWYSSGVFNTGFFYKKLLPLINKGNKIKNLKRFYFNSQTIFFIKEQIFKPDFLPVSITSSWVSFLSETPVAWFVTKEKPTVFIFK